DQIFSDEFNVIWDSSDLDEDELVYAVLFSADNGSTFSTLEIDYNKTNITLDPSKLQDCSLCGIKILATDGINTNSSISEAFGIDTTPPNITSIIVFNESDVVDGDVLRGDNITFNVTVTDEGIGIESVWVKIWEESIGISSVIWQGFLSFVSGDLWSVEIETDESFPIGDVNYTVYANDSVGNEMNVSDNFIIIPPIVDISILYPITDISVSQNQFFNVTVNVTCVQGNCGNINATLDPIPENEMTIELTNKRTYNQKAFNIEGNKIRYQIHAGHIHYKESDEFKDIDTSLVLTDSGWEMNKASYSVEIPEFSKGNFKFVNNYEDNKGDIVSMNPIVVNNVKGVLDEDNSVVYEDAFGTGIDLKVIAKNGGLDKLIVINEKPENLTGDLEFKYEIEMNSFDVKSENGLWDKSEVVLTGDTIVLDKTGETYFREFRLWDNSGKSSKVQVRLENVGDKYYLTKILAKGFLEEAIYPVVTDDTISYYSGSGDGHVYNYGDDWDTVHDASSGSSYDYTFSTAGAMDYYFEGNYYIYRSFVPIDTSGIDDNAVIDTASLYLYGDTIYSDLYPCDLHLVQTSQSSSSSLYYDDFNQIGSTEGTPAVDIGSLYTSSYNQFDLNSTGKAWIDKSGYTKFGLRTYYDFNDIDPDDGYQEGYCWFHYKTSEESGTDNDPYLEVDIDYINKGIIPFTIGDIPFYTNETNPRETASLSAGQSEVIIYWVNATGPVESYLFFAFANLTNEMSVGDMSEEWFVDIV
ncbi:hypothetical protein GOV12_07660, partial [Candidatus Pacearchaeota archaeon]|nr:hypothetical protein [Candidatus Pacearchaeota archaeon]